MKSKLLIALALLILYPAQAPAGLNLQGRLILEDEQGGQTSAAGIPVRNATTGESVTTDDQGRFRLPLPEGSAPGAVLKLQARKSGWVIHRPLEGEIRVPAGPEQVVEIHLLPLGSERLWDEEHISALIAGLIFAAKTQVTPDGGLEGLDFSSTIEDWADRYGFTANAVRAKLEHWAGSVAENGSDPYAQGLAAFARKRPGEAERLLAQSAESRATQVRQQADSGRVPALLEDAVRDYQLAGDCAYADYRFKAARDH
jgi:hypothetical protein